MKNKKLITISVLILGLIWILASNTVNNEIFMPKISSIIGELKVIFLSEGFLKSILSSLGRGIISVIISVGTALLLGYIGAFNKYIYNFLYPIITILKSVPTIAFIVIALIWLDKEWAPLLIGFVISFPLFYEITLSSIWNIDKNLIEMAETYRVGLKDKIKGIYIPNTINCILASLGATISLVLKVVICGEVYGQPEFGIGTLLQMEKVNFNMVGIFAWIIIIGCLSFLIEMGVKVIERGIKNAS